MTKRQHSPLCVAAIAAVAVIAVSWQAAAQPGGRGSGAPAKEDAGMQCPMMSAMQGLKLEADHPTVLLAMDEKLNLTGEQKEQIQQALEAARKKARNVLNDQQREQLADAPEGELSMMQVVMLLKDGQGKSKGKMCPMCMKKMHEHMGRKRAAKRE